MLRKISSNWSSFQSLIFRLKSHFCDFHAAHTFLKLENEAIVEVYLICFIIVYIKGQEYKFIFVFGSQTLFFKISFLTLFYSLVYFFSIIACQVPPAEIICLPQYSLPMI